MNRVLITGATGLVGSHLLRMLRQRPEVSFIAAPTRRPLAGSPGLFNPCEPQLSDALAQCNAPVDTVFCCLGTTRREAGGRAAFAHVDYTLVLDTAQIGQRLGAQHMLVVSAMGASAGSPFFYNRIKGEMEQALIARRWPRLTIARPSMLLGNREKHRLSETLLAPLFRLLPGNWRPIMACDVARAMLAAALLPLPPGVNIIPSAKLREIAARRITSP